ncbi:MAG: ATPase domain-containing protein [Candidatus Diapherotrites archaeon]
MHWFVDNLYEVYREAERFLEHKAVASGAAAGQIASAAKAGVHRQAEAAASAAGGAHAAVPPQEGADTQNIFSIKDGETGPTKVFKRDGKGKVIELMPTGVSRFDELIKDGGLERGSTILISGGTGTGKTTFALQSLYNRAKKGERGIYISFEEEPEKIILHMKKNFGWDFEELRNKGMVELLKFDPTKIARSVEESIVSRTGTLRIGFKQLELPFLPDRIVVDSLSALSIAFETEEYYRKYIRLLFEALESFHSVNMVLTETEQNPTVYSRTGVEEFLADGVVVLYNVKLDHRRENALEILKLRSSKHEKRMVPYTIGPDGFDISAERKSR